MLVPARLDQKETAVAAGDGSISVAFPVPDPGWVWTGSMYFDGVQPPPGAVWSVLVGPIFWGSYGPGGAQGNLANIQARGGHNEKVTVVGVGFVAGQSYRVQWTGEESPEAGTPFLFPQAAAPSTVATVPGALPLGAGVSITHDSATAVDAQLLAPNAKRIGFSVQIDPGASNMYLIYGPGPAAVPPGLYSVQLEGGTSTDYFEDPWRWTGAVHRIWDGTTGGAAVTEIATS